MSDWIEWNGGKCPVKSDARVEVRFRDRCTGRYQASSLRWGHMNVESDIIAYRVCEPEKPKESANAVQIGGEHYKVRKIQPWDYIVANDIPYLEGNVIKYVSRWRDKGGLDDLRKAQHYLQKLIEVETNK